MIKECPVQNEKVDMNRFSIRMSKRRVDGVPPLLISSCKLLYGIKGG